MDDFLTPEARRVLDCLGLCNAGSIVEWQALGDLSGDAVDPAVAARVRPVFVSEHTFVVVWPDETVSTVTVKPFEGYIAPIPST